MKYRVYDKPPCVEGSTLLGVALTYMPPDGKDPYWYFEFDNGTKVRTDIRLWVEGIKEGESDVSK